jgi:hypothetical protein
LVNATSKHNLGTKERHTAAIGAIRSSKVAIHGCTFVNNTHNTTGGSVVRVKDDSTLEITNTTFLQNSAICTWEGVCGGGALPLRAPPQVRILFFEDSSLAQRTY